MGPKHTTPDHCDDEMFHSLIHIVSKIYHHDIKCKMLKQSKREKS
jgi:hypothetical protein